MAIKWTMDPAHSELGFRTKHMMIATVSGHFRTFSATLETDGDDLSHARVHAEADMNSVSTGSDQRDGHLKSPDFFDVENHPAMVFNGKSVEKKSDEEYVLHGDLTIRDVTKPVTLMINYGGRWRDPWGSDRIGFSLSGKIKRADWNLVWNVPLDGGGLLVSEEVKIFGEVQFTHSEA